MLTYIFYNGVFEISNKSNVNSTGLTDPKKSVIGTFARSLWNKSTLTPTVEMQSCLGQTPSWKIKKL